MKKFLHLVDDTALGGVNVALRNFKDPTIAALGDMQVETVSPKNARAQTYDCDTILIHFTVAWAKIPYLADLRRRNQSARIILIEHTYTQHFERWNVGSRVRFRTMLNIAYACVDQVIAVSNAQGDWLQKLTRTATVSAIPQSRCMKSLLAIDPSDDEGDKPVVFGAIGRFHQQKGFDELILAFRECALPNAVLRIAGYGEDEWRLAALAQGAPNIEFIGAVKDPKAFYEHVDCVIVPSRWEAFGLVASEAIAAGCYVIAADVDGLTEQIIGIGSLVPAGDKDRMVEVISEISATGRVKIRSVAKRYRDRAGERYNAMINDWRQLLSA